MKFEKIYNKKSITDKDVIRSMLDGYITDGKITRKFSEDEAASIINIYGNIDPAINILEVDNEDKFGSIYGSDLKALTYLIYNTPRSMYVKFDNPQYRASIISGACPLALVGWKRLKGIPYNNWKINEFNVSKDYVITPNDDTVIEKVFKLDCFLGKSLASTYMDEEGNIKWKSSYGLARLSSLTDELRVSILAIRYLRENGTYLNQHFATGVGSKKVEVVEEDYADYIKLYNRCSSFIQLMMSQRWAWYGNHRSSDMITDIKDWDKLTKSVDTDSVVSVGIAPKAVINRFGI